MAALSLTSKQQRDIEKLIRKWRSKLTWTLLVEAVRAELGINTTRQTLCTYTAIKNEYDLKKNELRGATSAIIQNITKSDIELAKQVEDLKAEVAVLDRQNSEQLRMIERIFANAADIPNLDLNQLVKPRSEER
ncbi:hypothetical protein [Photobacterium lipolyticum]|uniref:Uncharacterized protein n=1 Tax=Photobacterium lipolyticum TaxID=266810 RepID=A0A2T3MQT9_9GAMM|nr:hypothetical protein [Photobacterium lipolyticum]PSV99566.1 hypothetical protein C9I89_21690 [Photobacterium lipolyticum]